MVLNDAHDATFACPAWQTKHRSHLGENDQQGACCDEATQGRPGQEANQKCQLKDAHQCHDQAHHSREESSCFRSLFKIPDGSQDLSSQKAHQATGPYRGMYACSKQGVHKRRKHAAVRSMNEIDHAQVRVSQGLTYEDAPKRHCARNVRLKIFKWITWKPVEDGHMFLQSLMPCSLSYRLLTQARHLFPQQLRSQRRWHSH
mmetsp:Transcript_42173/g.98409  ORF Transcript_42173/g.98409 Transcript_42173/m.98409 type:complete len:202 (+) Transcript_42173:1776-2381(+)